MIYVVNVKEEPCTHFCARFSSYIPTLHGVDLTVLGNPFKKQDGYTRTESIRLYGEYLWQRYENNDKAVLDALQAILEHKGEVKLGCFCRPKGCHCDHILDVYDDYWLQSNF